MMILGYMLNVSEDDIICDLAETYHVLNYKELPPILVAVLCVGLNDESRIKRRISGRKETLANILLASMCDSLNFLAWSKTKDASDGTNRPTRILPKIMGIEEETGLESYETEDEFMDAWEKIIGG